MKILDQVSGVWLVYLGFVVSFFAVSITYDLNMQFKNPYAIGAWVTTFSSIIAGLIVFMIERFGQIKLFATSIVFDKDIAFSNGKEVLELAKNYDGNVYSTHIYPQERLPENKLIKEINQENASSYYHRILFVDDPIELDNEIVLTFSANKGFKEIEVLIPNSMLLFPKNIWYLLPRINVTSFLSYDEKKALTVIGFFRFYTERNISPESKSILASPTINIKSKNIILAKKVIEYLQSLNYGHFIHLKSLPEYESVKDRIIFQSHYYSFMSHLLGLASNRSYSLGIQNISLFGHCALFHSGVLDLGHLKTDVDIDLIIICERGFKDKVIEVIEKEKDKLKFKIEIIWGPNEKDFYPMRHRELFTVDIEIFEAGDGFYNKYKLLGNSIIPSCISIYMKDSIDYRLHKLLSSPVSVPSMNKRANILLNDRKGLLDFKKSIHLHKGDFDHVRILSHIIRNMVWVLTGAFQPFYEKAFEILEYDKILNLDSKDLKRANQIVFDKEQYSHDERFIFIDQFLDNCIRILKNLSK